MPSIKFIDLLDRKNTQVIEGADFMLGRGKDCALRIRNPEISLCQARIQFDQGKYRITNTGRNPLDINGQPVTTQALEDGDLLHLGGTRFLIRILHTPGVATGNQRATIRDKGTQGVAHLVLETGDGAEKIFPLEAKRVMIGRSAEAQIRFGEKNISRRHCAIDAEGDGFVAVKLSQSSAMTVNGRDMDHCRLKNGDRIHIGDKVLRFCHKTPVQPAAVSSAPAEATAFAPGDITWERPPHLLIDSDSGNARVFDLEGKRWCIGREPKCDIQLDEATVSRRHAQIEKSDGAFWVENLSRSATMAVNGRPAKRQRLHSGDQIQIGPHILVFISKRAEDARDELDAAPEHTIFADSAPVRSLAPRLILDTGGDTARTFHLEGNRLILGRSVEADIRLDDPSVSRIHGAIEKEDAGYAAVNLCNQSPLKVNQEVVTRRRLYSGDQIQLGTTVLAFMSDRPEDTRLAVETPASTPMRSHPMVRATLMGIALFLGVYVGYQHLYLPWNASRVLDRAAGAFTDGHYEKGREIIEGVLDQEPTAEQAEKAKRLLAGATLKTVQSLTASGNDDTALSLLAAYLAGHGTEADASLVWREKDRIHLKLGENLEKAGQEMVAMNQYAQVRAESIYFAKAEKQLSRLWRTTQVKSLLGNRRQAAAAVLVKTGETRYGARQYFFPVEQSAFLAFRTALWLAPDQVQPREKLAAMGRFHRDRGRALMGTKNWTGAAEALLLSLLVDPSDASAIGQLNDCRRKFASMAGDADKTLAKASLTVKQTAMAQQKLVAAQTAELVTDLLDTAQTAAKRQKDLIPFGKNAYTAFMAVLEIDPENTRARRGLENLRSRVRKQGLDAFAAGLWVDAERRLGGTLLVDPGDGEIRERLIDCHKKRATRTRSGQQEVETDAWFSTYLKDS